MVSALSSCLVEKASAVGCEVGFRLQELTLFLLGRGKRSQRETSSVSESNTGTDHIRLSHELGG